MVKRVFKNKRLMRNLLILAGFLIVGFFLWAMLFKNTKIFEGQEDATDTSTNAGVPENSSEPVETVIETEATTFAPNSVATTASVLTTSPTTMAPTAAATTRAALTPAPTTMAPTAAPTTRAALTPTPTTMAPTAAPTTRAAITPTPTTMAPTAAATTRAALTTAPITYRADPIPAEGTGENIFELQYIGKPKEQAEWWMRTISGKGYCGGNADCIKLVHTNPLTPNHQHFRDLAKNNPVAKNILAPYYV